MLARFALGFFKGVLLGSAVGSAVAYGAHWPTPVGGALAYLLAIGTAGTAGIFAGRAPWKDGAWIEAALKGLVGAGAGGGLYWLVARYAGPLGDVPGLTTAWGAYAPVYLAAIAGVFGALVELDHAGGDSADRTKGGGAGSKSGSKVRVVDLGAEDEGLPSPASTRADRKR